MLCDTCTNIFRGGNELRWISPIHRFSTRFSRRRFSRHPFSRYQILSHPLSRYLFPRHPSSRRRFSRRASSRYRLLRSSFSRYKISRRQLSKYRLPKVRLLNRQFSQNLNHHLDFNSFYNSAQQGCYVCLSLWRGISMNGKQSFTYFQKSFRKTWCRVSKYEYEPGAYFFTIFLGPKLQYLSRDSERYSTLSKSFSLFPLASVRHLIRGHELALNTASDPSWAIAIEWFNTCTQTHVKCNQTPRDGSTLPTRLIDLGTSGFDTEVRVIYTGEERPVGSYMTLSHRWSSGAVIKLTASTSKFLKSGFAISILPKTIRDAIIIVRRFRVRYLWVDFLCIFQDSIEDWRHEAAQMTYVYKNSLCNISATGISNSEESLFVQRDNTLLSPCHVNWHWDNGPKDTFHILDSNFWKSATADAPLNCRGWVIQERLLAPRVLHFGKDQLLWECHELDACETYPLGIPHGLGTLFTHFKGLDPSTDGAQLRVISGQKPDPSLNGYHIWNRILTSYMRCDLTCEEDKLVALSGIAKEMQHLLNDEYVAGLWRRQLPGQLLWEISDCKQANGSPSRRPHSYRAPSWSWASVDGEGMLSSFISDGILISILEARVTPVSDDITGQIMDGYIRLQGYLVPIELQAGKYSGLAVIANQKYFAPGSGCLLSPDVHSDNLSGEFYYLPIHSSRFRSGPWVRGLVLQKTGQMEGQYKRFGTLSAFGNAFRIFNPSIYEGHPFNDLSKDSLQQTITLV